MKLKVYPPLVAAMLTLLLLPSCAEVPLKFLENRSDRVSITGEYCTQDPEALETRVRLLFIIDASGSNHPYTRNGASYPGNDPQNKRSEATQDIINKYINPQYPNYKAAVIGFSDSALALTPQFTNNLMELTTAIDATRTANGGTNTPDAFNKARVLIEQDIESIIADPTAGLGALAETYYFTIFISDGIPEFLSAGNQYIGPPQSVSLSIDAVNSFMRLNQNYPLGGLVIHSIYLAGPPPNDPWSADAEPFMRDVAHIGGGTFKKLTADELKNLIEELELIVLRHPYDILEVFIQNVNSVVNNISNFGPQLLPDSDGDGLSDREEKELGTDPLKKDTDDDGLDDLTEIRRLLDPKRKDNRCNSDNITIDRDQDGLSACIERELSTNDLLWDTDEDLIPDILEHRYGTDPLIADAFLDLDGDGRNNISEIKSGMNPNLPEDQTFFETYAIQQRIDFTNINSKGQYCYNVNVGNIVLVPTLTLPGEAYAFNTIQLFIIQRKLNSAEPPAKTMALGLGEVKINVTKFFKDYVGNTIDIGSVPFRYIVNP